MVHDFCAIGCSIFERLLPCGAQNADDTNRSCETRLRSLQQTRYNVFEQGLCQSYTSSGHPENELLLFYRETFTESQLSTHVLFIICNVHTSLTLGILRECLGSSVFHPTFRTVNAISKWSWVFFAHADLRDTFWYDSSSASVFKVA